jgi:GxxExxY protein
MSTIDKPFAKEGYTLMAAAFEVHNELGGGLAEEIYQQSFEIELEMKGVPFCSKQELLVFYKKNELRKRYIPDLVVYGRIVVELKALSDTTPEHEGQLINYMRISKSPVGYLINFGPMSKLTYKRFILSEFVSTAERSLLNE